MRAIKLEILEAPYADRHVVAVRDEIEHPVVEIEGQVVARERGKHRSAISRPKSHRRRDPKPAAQLAGSRRDLLDRLVELLNQSAHPLV